MSARIGICTPNGHAVEVWASRAGVEVSIGGNKIECGTLGLVDARSLTGMLAMASHVEKMREQPPEGSGPFRIVLASPGELTPAMARKLIEQLERIAGEPPPA